MTGTHLCISGPTIYIVMKKPSHEEQITFCRPDNIVVRQRYGQKYKTISDALSVPRSTVTSVIVL